ncbi:MAG: hypothetical protein QNJ22_19455 [Desulfosarcinaceae bacterium]|nr:hypothetical protein [Desulfosarcinaceae bacterium]
MARSPFPNRRPYCFADLATVFPKQPNGLRETPPACMVCHCKTECLRAALNQRGGEQVEAERIDRAYKAGAMSFLDRWSRKKTLHQKRMARKGKK